MLKIIVTLMIALTTLATPTTRDELLDSISRLSGKINDDVWRTRATTAQLQDANQKLLLAYKLIRSRGNGGGTDNRECTDYSFSILDKYYSSTTALQRAKEICRSVSDMTVFKFSFVKLERNYSEKSALERAANYAGRDMFGKYELLEFTYTRYERMYSNTSALDRAYQMTKNHSSYDIDCFRRYYPRFEARNSTSRALELTSNACLTK
jgi:hypothetical protein